MPNTTNKMAARLRRMFTPVLGMLVLAAGWLAGCVSLDDTAAIPAVRPFDVARYMGSWYEIARLPHIFERGMNEVKAVYTLNADGSVKVVNSGVRAGEPRQITGVAQMGQDPLTGELLVSFFRPFYAKYRVIYLSPDYRVAVVCGSTRDYFWILARTPSIPPEELRALVAFAAHRGFAVRHLEYPLQKK